MIFPFRGNFALTQKFGEHPENYKQFGTLGHNGLDYGLPTGTQIIAPHDGKIIEATNDPLGYGNYIKIENGKEGSVLAHLQSFQVKVGDSVSEGQPIALSNNTGNSTGPHLHWGYYRFPRDRANGYAGFINQLPLLVAPPLNTQDILDKLRRERDENYIKYVASQAENKALKEKLQQIHNLSS